MLKPFLAALLYEIVRFLKKHRRLEENISELKIPEPFKKYIASAAEKNVLADLKLVIDFVSKGTTSGLRGNAFFTALIEFLTKTLAMRIDAMHAGFHLSEDQRSAIALKLIPGDTALASALRTLLLRYSYQEWAQEISRLTRLVSNAPTLVVQTACNIDLNLKKEVRKELSQKNSHSFAAFQINRKLIGGFRIFREGKTTDYSWKNRIDQLLSPTH